MATEPKSPAPKRPTKEERALRLLAEARVEKAQKLAIASSSAITKLLRSGQFALAKVEAAALGELLAELTPGTVEEEAIDG